MRLLHEDDLRWVTGGYCSHGLMTSEESYQMADEQRAAEEAMNNAATALFGIDPNDTEAYDAAMQAYDQASQWCAAASSGGSYMDVCSDPLCNSNGGYAGQGGGYGGSYGGYGGGGSSNNSGCDDGSGDDGAGDSGSGAETEPPPQNQGGFWSNLWGGLTSGITNFLGALGDMLGLDGSFGYDGPVNRMWMWEPPVQTNSGSSGVVSSSFDPSGIQQIGAVGGLAQDSIVAGFKILVDNNVIRLTGDPIRDDLAFKAYEAQKLGLNFFANESAAERTLDRLYEKVRLNGAGSLTGVESVWLYSYVGGERSLDRFAPNGDFTGSLFPTLNGGGTPIAGDVTNYAGDRDYSSGNYNDYVRVTGEAINLRERAADVGFLVNFGSFVGQPAFNAIVDNQRLYWNHVAAVSLFAAEREASDARAQ